MADIFSTKDLCTILTTSVPSSLASGIWSAITALWPWHWLAIGIFLSAWIAYEIATRYGDAHYNSDNGFSPLFNKFVGSGTYLGLQALVYLALSRFFGDGIYCMRWPYVLHIVVFISTGFILHFSGFWPYLAILGGRPSRRGRQR